MNFELLYALKMLGDGLEPYYVTESLDNYDITVKRQALESLRELCAQKNPAASTAAIKALLERIALY
jgi:hypothetical protein